MASLGGVPMLLDFSKMSEDERMKKPRLEAAAQAVLEGNVEKLRTILDDGNRPDTDETEEWLGAAGTGDNREGWNVLHLAAQNNQVACIELLVEKCPKLVMSNNSKHETPLLLAVENERELETIKALIKGNGRSAINYNPACPFASIPLWSAFRAKRPNNYAFHVCKLLVENGASVKQDMLRGAIIGGNIDCIKLMLEKGCKANAHYNDYYKEFPLSTAAEQGNVEILKLLLKHAPSMVKARNTEGYTALMQAVTHGNVECARELIAAGADPNAMNHDGLCVLTAAAASGKPGVVKLLLQQKSVRATAAKMSNWRDESHPLTNAVSAGLEENVRLLASSKFFRGNLRSDDEEPMGFELEDEFCIDWGSLGLITWAINDMKDNVEDIVNALLDEGYDPVDDFCPPLNSAVGQMSSEKEEDCMERITRRLLEEGADLNHVSREYKGKGVAPDAFVVAIQTKNVKALRLLLQYWPKVPALLAIMYNNRKGVSPLKLEVWLPVLLEYGLAHGHTYVNTLIKLIEAAKFEVPTTENRTPKNDKEEPPINKQEIFDKLLQQLGSPSSLLQLARFALRQNVAKDIAKTKKHETLPTALKRRFSNLPNLMLPYLLMEYS